MISSDEHRLYKKVMRRRRLGKETSAHMIDMHRRIIAAFANLHTSQMNEALIDGMAVVSNALAPLWLTPSKPRWEAPPRAPAQSVSAAAVTMEQLQLELDAMHLDLKASNMDKKSE